MKKKDLYRLYHLLGARLTMLHREFEEATKAVPQSLRGEKFEKWFRAHDREAKATLTWRYKVCGILDRINGTREFTCLDHVGKDGRGVHVPASQLTWLRVDDYFDTRIPFDLAKHGPEDKLAIKKARRRERRKNRAKTH